MEITKQEILDTIADRVLADPAMRGYIREMLSEVVMFSTCKTARLLGYSSSQVRRLPIAHIQEGSGDRRYPLRAIREWQLARLRGGGASVR
jgi:hypothetical protein